MQTRIDWSIGAPAPERSPSPNSPAFAFDPPGLRRCRNSLGFAITLLAGLYGIFPSAAEEVDFDDVFPSVQVAGSLKDPQHGNFVLLRVALGDLDRDGDLDLFITPGIDHANHQVWLNNGDGTFVDRTGAQHLGPQAARQAALGDIDLDGDLDVVVATSKDKVDTQYEPEKVWLNQGQAVFVAAAHFGAANAASVALGDLNGDGFPDAFVAGYDKTPDQLWTNKGKNGAGILELAGDNVDVPGGGEVYLGDFDGDGTLEAFVASASGDHTIFSRDPKTGNLAKQKTTGLEKRGATYIAALGDVDNNGLQDILIAQSNSRIDVFLNRGDWNFVYGQSLLGQPPDNPTRQNRVALGDLDGDGDLDILSTAGNPQHLVIGRNDGGKFVELHEALKTPGTSMAVHALGDLDGDGDLDVVGGGIDNQIKVWLNQTNKAPKVHPAFRPPPVRARMEPGLWSGVVRVDRVSFGDTGLQPAAGAFSFEIFLHVGDQELPEVRLLKDVVVAAPKTGGTAPVLISKLSELNNLALRQKDGKWAGIRYSATAYDFDKSATNYRSESDSVLASASGDEVAFTLELPGTAQSHPFRHHYHPDLRDPNPENFKVTRTIQLRLPAGPSPEEVKGTFHETLTGLRHFPVEAAGAVTLRRIAPRADLNK